MVVVCSTWYLGQLLPHTSKAYVTYTVQHYGGQSVVLFDGCGSSASTKAAEQQRRATQSISAYILFQCDMKTTTTKAVFTPQLWDRNGSGTQPGARVHTCSTASGRSGTSRPPRDVIAVERFRNGSGWLCGVNARLDPFRNRSSCP